MYFLKLTLIIQLLSIVQPVCKLAIANDQNKLRDLGSAEKDGKVLEMNTELVKELGFWLPQNTKFTHDWKLKNETYKYTWITDQYARRITPVDESKRYTESALFFGCSFTFGTGLEQNETLPYYFGDLQDKYRPYNYGVMSTGPHQYLRYLELYASKLKEQIKFDRGIIIYVSIADHLNRIYGSLQKFWLWDSPYYELDNGELLYRGTFWEDRWLTTWIYNLLYKVPWIRNKNIDFPKIAKPQKDLYCSIVNKMGEVIRKELVGFKFLLLPYPGSHYPKEYLECIDSSIRIVDIENLDDWKRWIKNIDNKKIKFPDTHPKSMMHEQAAKSLVNYLHSR